jgi:hypothetical protein
LPLKLNDSGVSDVSLHVLVRIARLAGENPPERQA